MADNNQSKACPSWPFPLDEDLKIEESKKEYATEVKLFGRWSYEGVVSKDISLMEYVNLKAIKTQVFLPYTAGRYQKRSF